MGNGAALTRLPRPRRRGRDEDRLTARTRAPERGTAAEGLPLFLRSAATTQRPAALATDADADLGARSDVSPAVPATEDEARVADVLTPRRPLSPTTPLPESADTVGEDAAASEPVGPSATGDASREAPALPALAPPTNTRAVASGVQARATERPTPPAPPPASTPARAEPRQDQPAAGAARPEPQGDRRAAPRQAGEPEGQREGAAGPAPAGRGEGAAGVRARATEDVGEEEPGDQVLPDEVAAEADASLEAPPLTLDELAPRWDASDALPDEALASLDQPTGAAAVKPEPGKKKGEEPKGDSQEQQREAQASARNTARAQYADVARNLRREEEEFVTRALEIMRSMDQTYRERASELIDAHRTNLGAVDEASDRAVAEVESALTFAELAVGQASREAAAAITAAGRSAYGLINADDRTAAGRISAVVSGLVAGHAQAYNGAINELGDAGQRTLQTLNSWRDARSTNYPTSGTGYLGNAVNESNQSRIPNLVDPEARRLNQRITEKSKAWGESRDKTVCSLSCSYRAALDAERIRTNEQGRTSVGNALSTARKNLRQQARAGEQALREIRASYVNQIRTRQNATKSGLTSQSRAALEGLHHEAQGGIGGVHSAAEGALPTFSSAAHGLEQAVRDSAPHGAAALERTASQAAERILASTRRARGQLDERLDGNRARLETSLAERSEGARDGASTQVAESSAQLAELTTQASAQVSGVTDNFLEAFSGLAGTVTQAASSWAQPLATRMAGFIASKRAEAASALQSLRSGEAPATGGGGGGGGGGAATNAIIDGGVGRASMAISGMMITAAMIAVCTMIESGTVYHFWLPTLIDGWTTSPNMSRGTAYSLSGSFRNCNRRERRRL